MIDSHWSKNLSSFNTKNMNVCLDQFVRDFLNSLETQLESMTPGTVLNNKLDHVNRLSQFQYLQGHYPQNFWVLHGP